MNPCTCPDPLTTGMMDFIRAVGRCPVHGDPRDRTIRCAICQAPMGTAHAKFCIQGKRDEPDLGRTPEGIFEGMSRAGLSQLADTPVGTIRRINGHDVWRWEESSPITRLLSDGRPEGYVDLSEAWMARQDLGSPESALRAAMKRWPGREWSREDGPLMWGVRITWRTPAKGEERRARPWESPTHVPYYAVVKDPGAIVKITGT